MRMIPYILFVNPWQRADPRKRPPMTRDTVPPSQGLGFRLLRAIARLNALRLPSAREVRWKRLRAFAAGLSEGGADDPHPGRGPRV